MSGSSDRPGCAWPRPAERSCAERRVALGARREPYDEVFRRWLAMVD